MSNTARITTSKLVSLANAVRGLSGGNDLLTLPEMVELLESTGGASLAPGTYDVNGNMLKSWDQLVADGDVQVSDLSTYGNCLIITQDSISSNFNDVAKIVINEGVNRLYNSNKNNKYYYGTFENCASLTTVILPMSLNRIEKQAFKNCSALETINLPPNIVDIPSYMFNGCKQLAYIDISNHRITRIEERAFGGCEILDIKFSESIPYTIDTFAFASCYKLKSLPPKIRSIGERAFGDCRSLTEIYIPSDTTSIGSNPFTFCSNLSSIIVDPDNSIFDSRNNCNAIIRSDRNGLITGCKNTVIPNDTKYIFKYAFMGCSDLTEIIIPDSVTSIGESVFTRCDNLHTIRYSGTATGAPWGAPNATVVPNN